MLLVPFCGLTGPIRPSSWAMLPTFERHPVAGRHLLNPLAVWSSLAPCLGRALLHTLQPNWEALFDILAHWTSNCHAHCKSGTQGIFRQKSASTANRSWEAS